MGKYIPLTAAEFRIQVFWWDPDPVLTPGLEKKDTKSLNISFYQGKKYNMNLFRFASVVIYSDKSWIDFSSHLIFYHIFYISQRN